MKKKLLCLLLLVAAIMNAQNVNFTDSNFKNIFLTGNYATFKDISNQEVNDVDFNDDGQISESEALQIKEINISSATIYSTVGIGAFTNVEKLTFHVIDGLTGIDVTALTNLNEFNFSNCSYLTSMNVTGLTSLHILNIVGVGITSLDATSLTGLTKLVFNNNSNATTVNVSGLTTLIELDVSYCSSLSSLVLSGNTGVLRIFALSSALTTLNTEGLVSLQRLYASQNSIAGTVDLSDSANLINVDLGINRITLIEMPDYNPGLLTFDVHYNLIEEVEVGYCPLLTEAYLDRNNLQSIDMSLCPLLSIFYCNSNPLGYVNLKNGNSSMQELIMGASATPVIYPDYIQWVNNSNPVYVCIDGGGYEESYLQNSPVATLYKSTYCTFTPGGNYNTITGNVTFDIDNDGCEASDVQLSYAPIQITTGTSTHYSYTFDGTYNFYSQQGGTFTVEPHFENDWFTASPASVTFSGSPNEVVTQDFCVTTDVLHNDVEVVIVPLIPARPGFDAVYEIVYRNKGNQTLSGDITFTYNEDLLDFVTSLPTETSATTGNLTWSYSDLLPFEARVVQFTLNAVSSVAIGHVFNLNANITPLTGDETQLDNAFNLKQTVVGSLDPNEIICLDGTTVSPDKIGEYLHYNINFENTGNAAATFIAIKDVINTSQFDVNSLQILYASHPIEARITANKVEFYFGDINLAANGGKGNVSFKIKTLNSLTVNSSVMQIADIFFDYNDAVTTNEATTTFAVLSTDNLSKETLVKLYPNPAKNTVNITAHSSIQTVQVYDVQGRLLQAANAAGLTTAIDVSGRAAGIYFVKVITDKGTAVEKLVKE